MATGESKAGEPNEEIGSSQQAQPGTEFDWTQYPDAAYLSSILQEIELLRVRTERINRNTMIIVALLAIGIIVLIIVWLDLIGALPFF